MKITFEKIAPLMEAKKPIFNSTKATKLPGLAPVSTLWNLRSSSRNFARSALRPIRNKVVCISNNKPLSLGRGLLFFPLA